MSLHPHPQIDAEKLSPGETIEGNTQRFTLLTNDILAAIVATAGTGAESSDSPAIFPPIVRTLLRTISDVVGARHEHLRWKCIVTIVLDKFFVPALVHVPGIMPDLTLNLPGVRALINVSKVLHALAVGAEACADGVKDTHLTALNFYLPYARPKVEAFGTALIRPETGASTGTGTGTGDYASLVNERSLMQFVSTARANLDVLECAIDGFLDA